MYDIVIHSEYPYSKKSGLYSIYDIELTSKVLITNVSGVNKIISNISTNAPQYLPNIIGITVEIKHNDDIKYFMEIKDKLPNLEILYLCWRNKINIGTINNNDNNINSMTLLNNLPNTLKYLEINMVNIIKENYITQQLENLPYNLETLVIVSYSFNQPLYNLPSGLKKLSISSNKFNQSLDNLPPGLKTLVMSEDAYCGTELTHTLDNIPDTIKKLTIPPDYSIELNKLPISLERIKYNAKYIHSKKLKQLIEELNAMRNDNEKVIVEKYWY